jgi:hypothetical protein
MFKKLLEFKHLDGDAITTLLCIAAAVTSLKKTKPPWTHLHFKGLKHIRA